MCFPDTEIQDSMKAFNMSLSMGAWCEYIFWPPDIFLWQTKHFYCCKQDVTLHINEKTHKHFFRSGVMCHTSWGKMFAGGKLGMAHMMWTKETVFNISPACMCIAYPLWQTIGKISCCVVGCQNRKTKQNYFHFYFIPSGLSKKQATQRHFWLQLNWRDHQEFPFILHVLYVAQKYVIASM